MATFSIIGPANPYIGEAATYSVQGLFGLSFLNNPLDKTPYEWDLQVMINGVWQAPKQANHKTGEKVTYTFGQPSLTREKIRMIVTKGNESAYIFIKTQTRNRGKIHKVDLLDVNGNKVKGPLSYMDTLTAKAHCTDMEGETVYFTLWEDDAQGAGHNKANEPNKINIAPVIGKVVKGVATARFNMMFYWNASMIANARLAKGDKNEGATHEYYATASYFGKLEASNNINLKNPDYRPQPKKDTYKTPVTSKSKTKTPDPKGWIENVLITDRQGNPITSLKTSQGVIAKIVCNNLKGKTVRLKLWEDDYVRNDLIWQKDFVLIGNENYVGIPVTDKMWAKGNDMGDVSTQEYFLEVEYAGDSKDSTVIEVKKDKLVITEINGKSTNGVKDAKKDGEKKNRNCSCNENLTKEDFTAIAVNATGANIDEYFVGFNETFKKFNINSCLQKIHFLAQIIHESGSFRYNVELGNAAYLAKYGGWHGRGLIQLTTKSNYEAFEKAIGEDVTSSAEARDKVTKSPYAVYSAGWFWEKRAILNDYANKNDFIYITYRVNGGFNHIDDRLSNVKRGFITLYSKCVNDSGKNTNYKFKDSKAHKDKKASFAWGLWHDPQFSKSGCTKSKDLAIEGYQQYIDLTHEFDETTNYYSIQKINYFSDLIFAKIKNGKSKKFVNVRKAALKRLNDLKNG